MALEYVNMICSCYKAQAEIPTHYNVGGGGGWWGYSCQLRKIDPMSISGMAKKAKYCFLTIFVAVSFILMGLLIVRGFFKGDISGADH